MAAQEPQKLTEGPPGVHGAQRQAVSLRVPEGHWRFLNRIPANLVARTGRPSNISVDHWRREALDTERAWLEEFWRCGSVSYQAYRLSAS